MWMLRIGKLSRWDGKDTNSDHDLSDAALDLTRRAGEDGLSLFRVADENEANRVAALFASTLSGRPDKVDYVLFPESCLGIAGLAAQPVPNAAAVPYLSDRHCEIIGIDRPDSTALARAILNDPEHRVIRASKSTLIATMRETIAADPSMADRLLTGWPACLNRPPSRK